MKRRDFATGPLRRLKHAGSDRREVERCHPYHLQDGTQRFGELRGARMTGYYPAHADQAARALEDDRLVIRKVYAEVRRGSNTAVGDR